MTGDRFTRDLDDVRRRWVPDRRLGVFDAAVEGGALVACTTSRDALERLRELAAAAGLRSDVRALPDVPEAEAHAVVTAALAPLTREPVISSERTTEALHGETLAILERRASWLRVRAEDGYVGWLHGGYAEVGSEDWASDWRARASARALAAVIQVDGVRIRLPALARVSTGPDDAVELADGRHGRLVAGAARALTELGAEARTVEPHELALRWYAGAPYLWGGRTDWGTDCSGLVQNVWAARGVALARDSDLQFTQGVEVATAADGARYEPGDLLYFASEGRVTHVAMWAGGGRVVHSALSRGGVGLDSVYGDSPMARRLQRELVGVRRHHA
jgi:hypothetical protein